MEAVEVERESVEDIGATFLSGLVVGNQVDGVREPTCDGRAMAAIGATFLQRHLVWDHMDEHTSRDASLRGERAIADVEVGSIYTVHGILSI